MGSHDYLRRRVLAAVYGTLPAGELFARSRAGDPEAFVALVRDRYALVAAAVRRRLRPGEPVEDVVLDTFAELWRQRESVADPGAVDGWLTRTADRLAVRWVADRARERNWRPADVTAFGPDDAAALAELADRVQRAVAELSAADRAVIAAAGAFETDAAAAELLELPVGTYRVRLHRARERLRPILERYGFGPLLGLLGWAGGLLGKTARTHWLKWAAVFAAGGLVLGGVLVPVPTPDRPPPSPVEPLFAANLRRYEADVQPRLLDALRPLVVGDGDVVPEPATAADTRVDARFQLRHGPPLAGRVGRVRLLADTDTQRTLALVDLFGDGQLHRYHQLSTGRPAVLLRPWDGGPRLELPLRPLADAVAAFDRLPRDARAAAERDRFRAALADQLADRWGGWRHLGNPAEVWQLGWESGDDRPRLAAPPGLGWSLADGRTWYRVEPDGPVGGRLLLEDEPVRFTAAGRRLEFERTGEWWER